MAPFNNYCIVCDKLIVPIPNYTFNKLYCSESCQCMDKSILSNNIGNGKSNTTLHPSSNSMTVNDSIITSPLLIPILQDDQGSPQDTLESFHYNDYPHLMKSNNIFFNSLKIPSNNDHMAENNYKIWLNNI
ncbi:hypothetical protein MOSE0_D05710 [Monosporozyma servazzii]